LFQFVADGGGKDAGCRGVRPNRALGIVKGDK
jgi:hypothetical protein